MLSSSGCSTGPRFQALLQIEGCGPSGIVARARTGPLPAEWLRQPLRQRWLGDPLVIDAALQMLILWSWDSHQAPCLPCRIGRYRLYRRTFPVGEVRLVAQDRPEHACIGRRQH